MFNLDDISEALKKIRSPTVSEILDKTVKSAEKYGLDSSVFSKIKNLVEETLKEYAAENSMDAEEILKNNKIEHTDNGFKVTSLDELKTYVTVYYPDDFHSDSIIIRKGE